MSLTLILIAVGVLAFFGSIWLIRRMRQRITEEHVAEAAPRTSADGGFTLAAYQGVIQRLKEQEKELDRLHKAERERAQASENVSAAVLSNLPSGVLLFNPAGLVQQANDAAKAILGYASPFGLHARDLFRGVARVRMAPGEAESPAEALLDAVEQTLRRGSAFRRLEADYLSPGGERRVLGITLSPVRTAAGDTLGAACLISDLTEITTLARQVRLRENLAALGEMSAGIAHEFKNSLATISGYAQMLTTERDAETSQQFARKIAAETSSLTRIVTDFLNFARPQDIQAEAIELRPLLEDCARECGVALRFTSFPPGLELNGDPTALRQAFANLLRNSTEAARDGKPAEVEVSAESAGEALRLVLRDNGGGIPQEDLAKIFIPFFTTKSQGTGLGLALVHRILTEHGGSISVASNAAGSTFTLSFPAARPVQAVPKLE
ncbi:MAG: two-component system sensor histidine kinase NtrB [Terriglobales bacterium]